MKQTCSGVGKYLMRWYSRFSLILKVSHRRMLCRSCSWVTPFDIANEMPRVAFSERTFIFFTFLPEIVSRNNSSGYFSNFVNILGIEKCKIRIRILRNRTFLNFWIHDHNSYNIRTKILRTLGVLHTPSTCSRTPGWESLIYTIYSPISPAPCPDLRVGTVCFDSYWWENFLTRDSVP
jgi:hypothetical protein